MYSTQIADEIDKEQVLTIIKNLISTSQILSKVAGEMSVSYNGKGARVILYTEELAFIFGGNDACVVLRGYEN